MMRRIARSLVGLEHVVRKAVLRGEFEVRVEDAMDPVVLGVRYIAILWTGTILRVGTLRDALCGSLLEHRNVTSSVHFAVVVHRLPRDVGVK